MLTFFSSHFVIDITSGVCPDSNLIKPCSCNTSIDEIYCGGLTGGNEDIDLVKIFQTLENNLTKTEKHFKSFLLQNNIITELKENTFSDITFDRIQISFCSKLKTLHKNAFNNTDKVTQQIYIIHNPMVTSPDNSIFEILNKFVHATNISLYKNNITEIPSNAFKDAVSKQDQLIQLLFGDSSLRKLGNNAFSQLKNLSLLDLTYSWINFIPENAFEFNEDSEQHLNIDLRFNVYLNNSGFSEHSLTKLKRPTTIDIDNNNKNYPYLDEKIFQPFLLSNAKNQMQLTDGSLDCSDCRNYWLKKDPALLKKVIFSKCSNGKVFNDTENFKNCSSYL